MDQDLLASQKPADLDLHFSKLGISWFNMVRIKNKNFSYDTKSDKHLISLI